jgi:hypothetical protein
VGTQEYPYLTRRVGLRSCRRLFGNGVRSREGFGQRWKVFPPSSHSIAPPTHPRCLPPDLRPPPTRARSRRPSQHDHHSLTRLVSLCLCVEGHDDTRRKLKALFNDEFTGVVEINNKGTFDVEFLSSNLSMLYFHSWVRLMVPIQFSLHSYQLNFFIRTTFSKWTCINMA